MTVIMVIIAVDIVNVNIPDVWFCHMIWCHMTEMEHSFKQAFRLFWNWLSEVSNIDYYSMFVCLNVLNSFGWCLILIYPTWLKVWNIYNMFHCCAKTYVFCKIMTASLTGCIDYHQGNSFISCSCSSLCLTPQTSLHTQLRPVCLGRCSPARAPA